MSDDGDEDYGVRVKMRCVGGWRGHNQLEMSLVKLIFPIFIGEFIFLIS